MPVYHASGTVVMGRPEDPTACVDSNFRVYGTKRLRVADLSVCPLIIRYVQRTLSEKFLRDK